MGCQVGPSTTADDHGYGNRRTNREPCSLPFRAVDGGGDLGVCAVQRIDHAFGRVADRVEVQAQYACGLEDAALEGPAIRLLREVEIRVGHRPLQGRVDALDVDDDGAGRSCTNADGGYWSWISASDAASASSRSRMAGSSAIISSTARAERSGSSFSR